MHCRQKFQPEKHHSKLSSIWYDFLWISLQYNFEINELNIIISQYFQRLKEALQTGITSPTNESLHDKEIQVTKTILLVCVFFVLLFIPTALIIILDPLPPPNKDDYEHAQPMLHVIGYIINWCSAIVNPFIYVFTNQRSRPFSFLLGFQHTGTRQHEGNLITLQKFQPMIAKLSNVDFLNVFLLVERIFGRKMSKIGKAIHCRLGK